MDQDTRHVRGDHPYIFTNLKDDTGLTMVIQWLEDQFKYRRPARWQEPKTVFNNHFLAHHHD